MTAEVPATCGWNQRKLDTLKTALVDCSWVWRRFQSAAAMSVKLKSSTWAGSCSGAQRPCPPRCLVWSVWSVWWVWSVWVPGHPQMHQHTRLTYSTFFLVHLFLHQLGFPSLSPNPKVVNTPQTQNYPELVNTGNIIPYSSVIFRVSLGPKGVLVLPQQTSPSPGSPVTSCGNAWRRPWTSSSSGWPWPRAKRRWKGRARWPRWGWPVVKWTSK